MMEILDGQYKEEKYLKAKKHVKIAALLSLLFGGTAIAIPQIFPSPFHFKEFLKMPDNDVPMAIFYSLCGIGGVSFIAMLVFLYLLFKQQKNSF